MRLIRTVPLLLAIAGALLGGPARADDSSLTVDLAPGWDGAAVAGSWVPYAVDLKNDSGGQDFSGTLLLHARRPAGAPPNSSSSAFGTTYEQPITIARGATKRVTVYGEYIDTSSGGGGGYEAELVDRGGTVAARSSASVINPGRLAVGILSDSLEAGLQLKDVRLPSGATGVVQLTSQTLPANPILLGGLGALVIDGFDTASLSQAQAQALAQYVGLGGALVLGGGAGWRRTLSQLPPELVPLQPLGSTAVSLEPLMDLLARHSSLVVPSIEGRLAPGARIVLADPAGKPLAVEMGYGAGRIEQLTYDPADATLSGHPDEIGASWAAALGRVSPAAPSFQKQFGAGVVLAPLAGPLPQYSFGRGSFDAQVVNLLGDTSANALPPLGLLGGLLLLYILVAGPVNYAVLRGLRRREAMWITVPLIAVVFTGAAYGVGVAVHGSDYFVNEIQVLRVTPSGAVDGSVFDAVFSPRRGDLTVEAPEGSLVSTYLTPYYQGPQASSNDTVAPGREPVVHLRDVPVWSPRNLKSEAMARETVSIEAHLRLTNGRIAGTVANHGRSTVRRLTMVIADGRLAHLAVALAPGATEEVDAPLQALPVSGPGKGVACNQFGCQPVAPSLTPNDRAATVIQAAASSLLGIGQEQTLAGQVDPVAGVRVGGGRPSRSALAVFVAPVRLESLDTLPPGWTHPRVVAGNGSTASPVSVVDQEIPFGAVRKGARLSVGTASNFNSPAFAQQRTQAEVYDWAGGAWKAVDLTQPVILSEGELGSGLVRLRIQGNIYLQGLQIAGE